MKIAWGKEGYWAAIGLACNVGVAIALAAGGPLFLPNALYYLGTQVVVVVIALIGRPRLAAIGGIAISLSLYLAAFGTWVRSVHDREGLIWVGYLFSLPGAIMAALAIVLWLSNKPQLRPIAVFCISAIAVIIGVSISQTVVCKTVMYCSILQN